MAKSVQKIKSRSLRNEGKSIKEIAKKLHVSVSSVSSWCRDIELTPSQMEVLERRARDPHYGRRSIYLSSIKRQKDIKIAKLKSIGIKEIGKLSKRELFLIGCSLYWAEGFKKDKQVGFANLDVSMIKIFIKWLKICFGYTNIDISPRITLNISHKYRVDEVLNYWSTILEIPKRQFQKPYFQNVKWKKQYINPELYYGVLRIKVRKSLDFLRKIHGYIDGLKLNSD